MTLVITISALLSLWYLLVILFLRHGLSRLPSPGAPSGERFSIVIAARNEERNIKACLDSVLGQTITPDRFEVIVADDRSTDRTAAIVEELRLTHANLKLTKVTSCPAGVSPKKNALLAAIALVRNPVIVCTDADCRVQPTWLETLDRYLAPGVGFVQGVCGYTRASGAGRLFIGVQSIDFLSHGAVAAGAIGAGLPLNANGNNLAFRRAAFDAVGGYATGGSVALGDDDLLLQRIHSHPNWRVVFVADASASVETAPAVDTGELLSQRRRWASVSVHYGPKQVLMLSGVFLFYVATTLAFAAGLFLPRCLGVFAAMLLVKLLGEYLLLLPGTRLFGRTDLRRYILPASVPHLFLLVWAVLAGALGRFEWKGTVARRGEV
jgi:cellulose synthase/poly-beta-1,6-N-acetylglucosamine synthase-like glycosyltransferase